MRPTASQDLAGTLLRAIRYELLPTPSIHDKVLEHVPVGRTLTVTASVSLGLPATLSLAESLSRDGYAVVPHLAARMITGRGELAEIVHRLRDAGVRGVFVPAGDASPAAGDYQGSLDLLRDLEQLGRPFSHVGVAGYPESHPTLGDDVVIQAMWDKREHATHVVSNLCLEPDVVAAWVNRLRLRGVGTPVIVGMAGPVERTKLVAMATRIGVGESTRFLAKNRSLFTRIAVPGGYHPDRFLDQLARRLTQPGAGVVGVHLYTFNQVREAEQWRSETARRLGAMVS